MVTPWPQSVGLNRQVFVWVSNSSSIASSNGTVELEVALKVGCMVDNLRVDFIRGVVRNDSRSDLQSTIQAL